MSYLDEILMCLGSFMFGGLAMWRWSVRPGFVDGMGRDPGPLPRQHGIIAAGLLAVGILLAIFGPEPQGHPAGHSAATAGQSIGSKFLPSNDKQAATDGTPIGTVPPAPPTHEPTAHCKCDICRCGLDGGKGCECKEADWTICQ